MCAYLCGGSCAEEISNHLFEKNTLKDFVLQIFDI